jgi:putative hemolysin
MVVKEAAMHRQSLLSVGCLLSALLLAGCTAAPASPTANPTASANLPNPASVYCEEHGGRVDLRQDAAGAVAGVCVFPDGSECDEWAYYRGECGPAEPTTVATPTAAEAEATPIPTPAPISPADYEGWWTYTEATYGFSVQLPPDWVVDDTTTADPLMSGHLLWLRPEQSTPDDLRLRLTFRRVGEETLLWPTGVGQGEFVPQGTLEVAGAPARRVFFVCPNGQIKSVWYQGEASSNVVRGDLEFGFILSHSGGACQPGGSLEGKPLRVGEMIVASLVVPE